VKIVLKTVIVINSTNINKTSYLTEHEKTTTYDVGNHWEGPQMWRG